MSRTCLGFLSAAALGASARAQILEIEYFKTGIYQQTSNAIPQTSTNWSFAARIITAFSDDLFSADFHDSASNSDQSMDQQGTQWLWTSGAYTSKQKLTAAYPDNHAYHFELFGPAAIGGANISCPQSLFPAEIPHFAGNTYAALQGMNPYQPFTIELDGFEELPAATDSALYLDIYNLDNGYFVYIAFQPTTSRSFDIPAQTVAPGYHYVARAIYTSRRVVPDAHFDTADALTAYDLHTEMTFQPRLCIADLDGVPGVDLNDFFAFFNCFDATQPCADIDGNPGVDLGDFFAFFNAWDTGC